MSAEDIEYIGGYKEFPTKESALDWLDNYLSLDERNNLIRALQHEPVLDKIRAEIKKAIWEDVIVSLDGTDETRIPRLNPDDVFDIIEKYQTESEEGMTLDEAINKYEKIAEKNEEECESWTYAASQINDDDNRKKQYQKHAEMWRECAKEHRQIAEWLKELKAFREREEKAIRNRCPMV